MNALRDRNRVFRQNRRQTDHLWHFWNALSVQQADVRPRDQNAVSSLLGSPSSALWRIEKTSNWRYSPWLPRYGVEWLAEHPDTSVLSPLNDFYRPIVYPREDYYKSTYYRYRTIPNTMFPVWNRDGRLGTKAGVLGGSISDSHKAYPGSTLRALRVINDRVAGRDVVIVSSAISSDIRVYERDGQEFQRPSGAFDGRPAAIVDESGETWTAGESALVSEDGSTTLRRLSSNIYFWYAWFAFHPETDPYTTLQK